MPRARTLEKQGAILEAASKVFSAKAFHEVLCDEIAAEAKIGKGTLYRYFETKDDLYFATILHGFSELHSHLSEKLSQEASPARKLERITNEILKFFWNRRHFFALLYRNERRFLDHESELNQNREKLLHLLENVLREGTRGGQFRRVDSRIAAQLFLGMIRAASMFRREDDRRQTLARELLSIFTSGIGAEQA